MNITLNSRGTVRENIGYTISETGNRNKKKFSLGNDVKEATRRHVRIQELWEHVKSKHLKSTLPVWTETSLWIAEQLAKGQSIIRLDCRKPAPHEWGNFRVLDYARNLNKLTQEYPFIRFAADDAQAYEEGQKLLQDFVEREGDRLKKEGHAPSDVPVVLSAIQGTMHREIVKYVKWIEEEYFSREENDVNDTGVIKRNHVKVIRSHLKDVPLAALDTAEMDRMTTFFRKRPVSKRTKKRMARSYCANVIKELWCFFKWLHFADNAWRMPSDAHLIKKKVDEFDSDVEQAGVEIPVYTIQQLAILNKYATPLERVFLLLALNCGYGADQSGRLKLSHIQWESNRPYIKRIRRKKKVKSCHLLWQQTFEGLQWAKGNRPLKCESDWAIVKADGTGYWRKTAGGSRARDIPKRFSDLVKRVREDIPDFPWLGFNALRDTSINLVRRLSNEELASTHAAHAHQSTDRNLRRYSNPKLKALFKVHSKMERVLAEVFAAAPIDAFKPQKQAYLTVATNEKINEMLAGGEKISKIAKDTGVSEMTVRRRKKELDIK